MTSGDSPADLILDAVETAGLGLVDTDAIVVASKIIAKAEGRVVRLDAVEPSGRATEVAERTGQDARLVELILSESSTISRTAPGLLLVRHRLGFLCANAGIDRAEIDGEEPVILLPVDPDRSARHLRSRVLDRTGKDVGVVISDTHGRPFRRGNLDVAVGVAGLPAVDDRTSAAPLPGARTRRTVTPVADQLAAAAGIVMGQPGAGTPAVLLHGFSSSARHGSACDLVRDPDRDLYSS